MRIVFVCLGNPFSAHMLYKENYFIKACKEAGCDILVVADDNQYESGKLVKCDTGTWKLDNQTTLVRVKYDKVVTSLMTNKIRKSHELFQLIKDFRPDSIFYNCIQIYNIKDIIKLKAIFPHIRIYGDVSTTKYNSGLNILSKFILHRIIYKSWLKNVENYFTKIYYVVPESREFLKTEYGLSEERMEFNPLPAKVVSKKEKTEGRAAVVKKYSLSDSDIILVHAGKMGPLKKTLDILRIFSANNSSNLKLIIAGSFEESIQQEALKRIQLDNRIQYVGFLKSDELIRLLCAADLYIQPGSPSQIAQTAIGCWCPVVLPNLETYIPFYHHNGYLINDIEELSGILKLICREELEQMSLRSKQVAKTLLDYRVLAKELYEVE